MHLRVNEFIWYLTHLSNLVYNSIMTQNKKAYYDYEILEEYECGIKLEAWEVKAIANNNCSIVGTFCKILNDEVFLIGATIGTSINDIQRTRKLLLHRREITKLYSKICEKGLTLVPLKLYNKKGKFKLLIGVARGKKEYDKRATDKSRSVDDDMRRTIKSQKLA